MTTQTNQQTSLGHARLADFSFRPGYINLNHGAFGSCPKHVRDATAAHCARIEEAPDMFMRIGYADALQAVRKALSLICHCDPEDLAFVQNATSGVNAVLRSLKFDAQANGILHFSTIYGSCGHIVDFLTDHSDGAIFAHKIQLEYPASHAHILKAFEAALKSVAGIKVAVFDHIVSQPGVKMPWVELTRLCRRYNVLSLVDAAHGVGHVPIDLHSADPDFFISNCHKWLYSMRSTAILYVAKRSQHLIHSMPIGSGYVSQKSAASAGAKSQQKSPFQQEFEFPATIDFSPILAIKDALAYRASIGGEARIIQYTTELARTGGALIAKLLGTNVLMAEEDISMINVRLPLDTTMDANFKTPSDRSIWFTKTCAEEFNMSISTFVHGNVWWARFSAQVYLDLSDFEYGGTTMRTLCNRIRAEHKGRAP